MTILTTVTTRIRIVRRDVITWLAGKLDYELGWGRLGEADVDLCLLCSHPLRPLEVDWALCDACRALLSEAVHAEVEEAKRKHPAYQPVEHINAQGLPRTLLTTTDAWFEESLTESLATTRDPDVEEPDLPEGTDTTDLPPFLARRIRTGGENTSAARAVLGYREAELLELKGPCRTTGCRLHRAHSGPCDIKRGEGDSEARDRSAGGSRAQGDGAYGSDLTDPADVAELQRLEEALGVHQLRRVRDRLDAVKRWAPGAQPGPVYLVMLQAAEAVFEAARAEVEPVGSCGRPDCIEHPVGK